MIKTIKNNPVDMAFLVKTDSKDEQDKIAKKIENELEKNKSDKILDASVYRIDVLGPRHAELAIKVQFSSGERIRRFNIEKFDETWYLSLEPNRPKIILKQPLLLIPAIKRE